ncbi:MAG TPA: DNA mismatch repair protein MutS [Bacteroidia bacterium]|nr:DNA mismatch repair protein MutS [Bacteroidia bacterium]
MKLFGDDTLYLFEFDRVRERVEHHCRSASGKRKALGMAPLADRENLTLVLKQTDEFKQTLQQHGYFPDLTFEDFEEESQLLLIAGSMLLELQFSRIRSASVTVNSILKFLNDRKSSYPNLLKLTEDVFVTQEIIQAIDAIIDSHSQVKSSASPDLQDIRNQLSSKRREADKRFRTFIQDLKKKGWLRDNEENFYNNRRVLAMPSEYKREVKGIVHGKSESGKTTFVEPEALVELNNEIAELEQDERYEVMRLLRELTDTLRPFSALIRNYHEVLTAFDLVRAKANFAIEIKANLPQLSKNSVVRLINAVHPLLYLQNRSQNKEVVPLSIELNQDSRIVIISGPNAGGKSITLKTVGLLQLMLQSGLLVPADEKSEMCYFNHLLADIGDSQSIEYALSTYSSRLIRMNQFLRMANNRTLILIDEFGTGTDPELGGAIAEVVLEELNKRKAFGVFTTHYTNIKLLADHLEGVRNASMLFDPETLQPKYKMISGQPGSSYTFEVAERIGLPKHVLDRAKKKVQQDKIKLNEMLSTLHSQKVKLEQQLNSLKNKEDRTTAATEKFEQLREKLETRLELEKSKYDENRKLAELGRRMQVLADEWDKSRDKKPIIKKFVGQMTAEKKKKAAENAPDKVEKRRLALIEKLKKEIQIGSRVRMLKGKQIGIVEQIKKNTIYVNFGSLLAKVAIENLELAEDEKPKED